MPSVQQEPVAGEPYSSCSLLASLDEIIANSTPSYMLVFRRAQAGGLSDLQQAASTLVPQIVSVVKAIRLLVRHGHLFSAHMLVRPLLERTWILIYLTDKPDAVAIWNRGWKHGEAPSLGQMFDASKHRLTTGSEMSGKDMAAPLNALVHGRPLSARWNVSEKGHAPGPILDRPDLCNEVCGEAALHLFITGNIIDRLFAGNSTE